MKKKGLIKDAAVIAALRKVYEEKGGLVHPQDVVDAARPVHSPLHRFFLWDDTKAAEEYRKWQARELLQVTVEIIKTKDGDVPMQVFCSLSTDRVDGGYRAMVDVLSDKQLRAQLLEDALREMRLFEERYKRLSELAEVFKSMRLVRGRLQHR